MSSVTGNTFYNAAVYSGTKSWKAFFFGALDAGSFITKNGTAVSDYSGLYRLDASDVS